MSLSFHWLPEIASAETLAYYNYLAEEETDRPDIVIHTAGLWALKREDAADTLRKVSNRDCWRCLQHSVWRPFNDLSDVIWFHWSFEVYIWFGIARFVGFVRLSPNQCLFLGAVHARACV